MGSKRFGVIQPRTMPKRKLRKEIGENGMVTLTISKRNVFGLVSDKDSLILYVIEKNGWSADGIRKTTHCPPKCEHINL